MLFPISPKAEPGVPATLAFSSSMSATWNGVQAQVELGEGVESAFRLEATHVRYVVQHVHEEVAPPLILRGHLYDLILRTLQRGQTGDLDEGWGAGDGLFLDLADLLTMAAGPAT